MLPTSSTLWVGGWAHCNNKHLLPVRPYAKSPPKYAAILGRKFVTTILWHNQQGNLTQPHKNIFLRTWQIAKLESLKMVFDIHSFAKFDFHWDAYQTFNACYVCVHPTGGGLLSWHAKVYQQRAFAGLGSEMRANVWLGWVPKRWVFRYKKIPNRDWVGL